MTKEVLQKLPEKILSTVKYYREQYGRSPHLRDETRASMAGYVQGLRDAGIITERERQIVFIYMTELRMVATTKTETDEDE